MSLFDVRINKIHAELLQHDLDGLLIRSTSNIWWACGYPRVFDSEQAHALLVTHQGAWLHTDARYSTALRLAAKQAGDGELVIDDTRASHHAFVAKLLSDQLAGVTRDRSFRLGVENTISLKEFRQVEECFSDLDFLELVEVGGLIEGLREVKDATEVELLRTAQTITDQAFAYILTVMKPGMTEREVQRQLDAQLLELGADGLSFDTIVATGPRAALPHAVADEVPLERGQCVVMDFGARYQGYCADMTRTVFVGRPDAELMRAWEALRLANETCEAALQAGKVARDIHLLAESVLSDAGFAGGMTHSLGHGVGIDIHEGPTLSPTNHSVLQAGNVVTVEPGLYYAGRFGMRLEDFGLVGKDSFEVFTQTTHEMVII